MAKAYASTIVNAAVEDVWKVIGDFDGLDKWAAGIVASRLEGGDGRGVVGSVRILTRAGGGEISERLLSYDDVDRRLSYEFAGPTPFAVRTYRGTMTAAPVTISPDPGAPATFVEWFCGFDADGADEAALCEQFRQVFTGGLGALGRLLDTA